MIKVGVRARRPRVEGQAEHRVDVVELWFGPGPWPSAQVLARWRAETPEAVEFFLDVPPRFWEVAETGHAASEMLSEVWDRVEAAATLLEADTLVLRPPASFRPTGRHRDFLEGFFEGLSGSDFKFVWIPAGLWAPEDLLELAHSRSELVVAESPDSLQELTEFADWTYLHVTGLGRGGVSREDVEDILYLSQSLSDGVCVFDTGDERANWRAASRLAELAGQLGEAD